MPAIRITCNQQPCPEARRVNNNNEKIDLKILRWIMHSVCIFLFVVGAILEHEAIAGLSAGKPTGLRGRVLSNSRATADNKSSDEALDSLIKAVSILGNFLPCLFCAVVNLKLKGDTHTVVSRLFSK